MPCYRCGARQVDPDRGESPWKRGVRADRQVLICPACQSSVDWTGELDRCPVCSSAHLVRRLGEVECRDCGYVREPGASAGAAVGVGAAPGVASAAAAGAVSGAVSGAEPDSVPGADPDFGETPGLAEEVELALARVLGRAGKPARIG
jgi:hypothetical protein